MPAGIPDAPEISPAAASQALAYLTEMSPDLRGGAVLDADGRVLAASGDGDRWGAAVGELLAAADEAGSRPVEHVHVGTEDGEVFALRHEGLVAAVVTERFVLASLMTFDLRSALRDLAAGSGPAAEAG
jgi:predicted regulator of Ras-like GTPase activity (Roadblock/LC7/MglB family)